MSKSKILSVEVYKYSYCARPSDTKDYLSEKICRYTIKIRKKIVRGAKRVFVYGQLISSLNDGLAPSQAIGLPIYRTSSSIIRSKIDLSKKVIIARIIESNPDQIVWNEKQMDKLYDIAMRCKSNSITSKEQLISELRGGGFTEAAVLIGVIGALVLMAYISEGFQVSPNRQAIVPPHLAWLYRNQRPGNDFGYGKGAGPRSLTITGLTQNAGSEKKQPSSGSYNYVDVMKKLEKQSSKGKVEIQVGDQMYILKNPYRENAYELGDKLADKMYDSIRSCDTDICDIAENVGFKADNIKNVKDHVFYNEHDQDRYGPDQMEHKRFDPNLEQALAWKRLEAGTHTQDDINWIKHECAERHHELKYGSGYNEAHNRAQTRFDGSPWENDF